MTKLIAAFILIAVCYCGYRLFIYLEENDTQQKQAATLATQGESLPGLPSQLNQSLHAAQQQGAAALRHWLKIYGSMVQDPRKAWIELDLCVALARDDPAAARRIFKSVKNRTPPSSPVWPRLKQLEKSYE